MLLANNRIYDIAHLWTHFDEQLDFILNRYKDTTLIWICE